MYKNNLKEIRTYNDLTQQSIADELKCKRTTYNNWERGIVMIPLDIADKLSVFYGVRLSYILGIESDISKVKNIKSMDYNLLLDKLIELKNSNNHSYEQIATHLKCNRSTCNKYFTGKIKIPIDRLILLSNLYDIDLDKLCGKL